MRCEQAFVRVCDGLREDGEVDWQIARAARVNIVRNSASMNRGLGGRGGRRTARSAAFMAHLNRPGLKKWNTGLATGLWAYVDIAQHSAHRPSHLAKR